MASDYGYNESRDARTYAQRARTLDTGVDAGFAHAYATGVWIRSLISAAWHRTSGARGNAAHLSGLILTYLFILIIATMAIICPIIVGHALLTR